MPDFAQQRMKMVEAQVRANDVTDPRIADAMAAVARERFVPAHLRPVAYSDGCLEVAPGRFLPDPRSFSKLVQLAAIGNSDAVLDVGCASGYSAAILARLAGRVVALEEDAELVRIATDCLKGIANVEIAQGRLSAGLPGQGPYDAVFLNGAVEAPPDMLLRQLKNGGRLVAIIGESGRGQAHLFVNAAGALSRRVAFDAEIPVLPGFERIRSFIF